MGGASCGYDHREWLHAGRQEGPLVGDHCESCLLRRWHLVCGGHARGDRSHAGLRHEERRGDVRGALRVRPLPEQHHPPQIFAESFERCAMELGFAMAARRGTKWLLWHQGPRQYPKSIWTWLKRLGKRRADTTSQQSSTQPSQVL